MYCERHNYRSLDLMCIRCQRSRYNLHAGGRERGRERAWRLRLYQSTPRTSYMALCLGTSIYNNDCHSLGSCGNSMYMYTYIVHVYIHCTYTHTLYMYTYIVHVYIHCTYTHTLYMYTYIVHVYIHCTCIHTLYMYTYIVHIHILYMYTHYTTSLL